METVVIPYNSDNYAYLVIVKDEFSILVDPGSPDILNKIGAYPNVDYVLITHGDEDHVAGLQATIRRFPDAKIFSHKAFNSNGNHVPLKGMETFFIEGIEIKTKENYSHSRDHLAYLIGDSLYSGDILFSAGSGRFFSGNAEQMLDFVQWTEPLPDSTKMFFGHEYTQNNLLFASHVEPENPYIREYLDKFEYGSCSTPTTLGLERAVNPYLRYASPDIISYVKKALNKSDPTPVEVIDTLRTKKNEF